MLLGVYLLGTVGTGAELLLLGHYEEIWQLIPLGLITVSLTVLAMRLIAEGAGILRAFQALMILSLVAGSLGIYLHYQSNVEFELEMNPASGGGQLVWDSLTGAMPALAPGTMLQLGLIGLLYTWRHPVFEKRSETADSFPGGTP